MLTPFKGISCHHPIQLSNMILSSITVRTRKKCKIILFITVDEDYNITAVGIKKCKVFGNEIAEIKY